MKLIANLYENAARSDRDQFLIGFFFLSPPLPHDKMFLSLHYI